MVISNRAIENEYRPRPPAGEVPPPRGLGGPALGSKRLRSLGHLAPCPLPKQGREPPDRPGQSFSCASFCGGAPCWGESGAVSRLWRRPPHPGPPPATCIWKPGEAPCSSLPALVCLGPGSCPLPAVCSLAGGRPNISVDTAQCLQKDQEAEQNLGTPKPNLWG